jgi:hypothetical protein
MEKEEIKKAQKLLGKYGIEPVDLTGGNFVSFNADLGNDLKKAANIATEMFEFVFEIPEDANFDIIINR